MVNLHAYKQKVLEPIAHSPLFALGIMCALAAPLYNYVLQRTGRKILSESMVCFFHGPTTSGKSTISRLATSVYGIPHLGIDWAASDRAVAEAAYASNDLLTVVDDTEKAGLQDRDLYKRANTLGQRLPAGESKAISKFAQKNDLPPLRWFTIGISSGPLASATLAASAGTPRHGQVARMFDLGVPDGGVLAFGEYAGAHRAEARSRLMEKLEAGLTENYGVLMDVWIGHLIERDRSPQIKERVDWFVDTYADPNVPVTARIAKKIGLLYAAGRLAQRAGLLPWPDELPRKAGKYAYEEIVRGLTAVNDPLRELLRKLRASTQDHSLFVRCGRKRGYVRFGPDAVGLHIEDNGSHRWLLQRDRLTLLGIAQQNFRTVCKQMVEHGVIARSGNASATVQERVIDEVGRVSKMRFWILNPDNLPTAE